MPKNQPNLKVGDWVEWWSTDAYNPQINFGKVTDITYDSLTVAFQKPDSEFKKHRHLYLIDYRILSDSEAIIKILER